MVSTKNPLLYDTLMSRQRVVYSDEYDVDIGIHVFPTKKYRLVRERLIRERSLLPGDFESPQPSSDEDILLIHSKEYLNKLKTGTLSSEEIFRLELHYSQELVRASSICVNGTIKSCAIALECGVGIHLGGGFHHAFRDHGEGFCVFNDIAIAIRRMIKDAKITKAMTIDCDLHQGNGTADIFKDDKNVFTFSIHQQNNYPFYKPKSNLDIGLDDYTPDRIYLSKLREYIPKIISEFKPQLIVYIAGADPYKGDQIGNLALSIDGLQKRDEFIFETARNFNVPIAVVLAGGYAVNVDDTVTIHFNTVKVALDYSPQ
jgi:acetoin utilization deacetylase AcuC-like enzyme